MTHTISKAVGTIALSAFLIFSISSCTSEQAANNYDSSSFPIALDNGMHIQAPMQFKNLEVYLITGSADLGNDYTILTDAMNSEQVKVIETGSVNELSISSSSQRAVYVNAGDIVKGGKQDRTLGTDLIVEAMSEPQPVASFCVESGRWQQRGSEELAYFSANDRGLSSRKLKIAAQKEQDQSMVWAEVSNSTYALNSTLSEASDARVDITMNASGSSLELALSSEELEEFKEDYHSYYEDALSKHDDAIGLAYAINGEVFAIDIYNSQVLFADLWPKLIDATIVEAIGEWQGDSVEIAYADPSQLTEIYSADFSKEEVRELNDRTRHISTETSDCYRFETIDKGKDDTWTHISFIKADTSMHYPSRQGMRIDEQSNEAVTIQSFYMDDASYVESEEANANVEELLDEPIER